MEKVMHFDVDRFRDQQKWRSPARSVISKTEVVGQLKVEFHIIEAIRT
jgi:hypothetical protein